MSQLAQDEAKQFLKTDSNGSNLYDHLTETLMKLLVERPANSYEAFEDISASVKQAAFSDGGNNGPSAAAAAAAAAQSEWVAATVPATDGDEDASPEDPEGLQDLPDEAAMLEAAGFGFGREETVRLHAALKTLYGDPHNATNVRLWGRISGANGDYIVAEGEADADIEPTADLEGPDGANKFTYWVCGWAGGAWTKLPPVQASQIKCASLIKKTFSGDLNAPVTGYPPFPGNEANLLRAQIARISADTALVPSGLYDAEDEDNPGTLTQREEPEPSDDLTDLGAWCHFQQSLDAASGRCRKWEDPDAGDEDEAADEVEFNARDPLASAGDDDEGVWAVRTVGKMAAVRSLEWPGAVAVGYGGRFVNLYVGYGHKYSATPYQPQLPPVMRSEYTVGEEVEEEDTAARLIEAEDVITEPAKPEEEEEDDE